MTKTLKLQNSEPETETAEPKVFHLQRGIHQACSLGRAGSLYGTYGTGSLASALANKRLLDDLHSDVLPGDRVHVAVYSDVGTLQQRMMAAQIETIVEAVRKPTLEVPGGVDFKVLQVHRFGGEAV
jgi:hypothetical protein